MWHMDHDGTDLPGPKEAFRMLRERAQRAIVDGDRVGRDVRKNLIRLIDNNGAVLFKGTLEDAARIEINGHILFPAGEPDK